MRLQQNLDIERQVELVEYLRVTGRIAPGEEPKVWVLRGGVSNRTVQVERSSGERWVIKQALAKLRTNVEWYSDPARIVREAQGMRTLGTLAPAGAITRLIFVDPENDLLAMEAVAEPHENWKEMLLAGRLDFDHVEQFGALLGMIHRRSMESAEPLSEEFGDRSFFESLRLEPYYAYTAEQVGEARGFLLKLIEATRGRRVALVHGDYSPKNILVHSGRMVLLDHEVIHWGDSAFDVGFALAHLLSKSHHLKGRRSDFAQASWRFIEFYIASVEHWNDSMQLACVAHTLGCLLARVAGRSTLEYLNEGERARQREVVVKIMSDPPAKLERLIERFVEAL